MRKHGFTDEWLHSGHSTHVEQHSGKTREVVLATSSDRAQAVKVISLVAVRPDLTFVDVSYSGEAQPWFLLEVTGACGQRYVLFDGDDGLLFTRRVIGVPGQRTVLPYDKALDGYFTTHDRELMRVAVRCFCSNTAPLPT